MKSLRFVNFFPLEAMGGGEASVIAIGNALAKNFEVEAIASTNYSGPLRATSKDVSRLIRFKYRRLEFHRSQCHLLHLVERPLPSIDVLSDSDAILMLVDRPVCPAYLAELASKTKVFLLLHGVTVERPSPPSLSRLLASGWTVSLAALTSIGRRQLVQSSVEFQVFNPAQAEMLAFLGIPPSRVHFIPTGVSFVDYTAGRSEDEFRVIFLGRMDRRTKGINRLAKIITAMDRVDKEVKFDVVGTGPDSRLLTSLRGLGRTLTYHGFVAEQTKLELLSEANLLIVTSDVEPYSLAVVEGLASGLPAVSTPVSGPSGIIGMNSSFGIIANGGIQSLVNAILRYFRIWKNDPAAYYSEKVLRRATAARILDIGICVEKYKEMIDHGFAAG